jgi:phosphoserine phosphatase RsbX
VLSPPPVEVASAARPRPGERVSGDRPVLQPTPSGILVGVVDGLGHGEEAASAARRAEAVLLSDPTEPVVSLVRRCHRELRATRGAACSLAAIDALAGLLTWVGVGNVAGVLVRADPRTRPAIESLVVRSGVLGLHLPLLQPARVPIHPGDLLVFVTDGITSDYWRELTPGLALASEIALQPLAERIVHRHASGRDDALALVARYVGRPR